MNHVCMPLSFDVKPQRDQLRGVQCIKRSHVFGVPLRSRSLAKQGVHSHF